MVENKSLSLEILRERKKKKRSEMYFSCKQFYNLVTSECTTTPNEIEPALLITSFFTHKHKNATLCCQKYISYEALKSFSSFVCKL